MNQPHSPAITTSQPRIQRVAKPAPIAVADLLHAVRLSIESTEACGVRTWSPIQLSPLQELQRRTERRVDLLSCFVASLSGALQLYAPSAANEIYAYLMKIHSIGAPVADTTTTETKKGN